MYKIGGAKMLLDVIFILFAAVNIVEIMDVMVYKESYPFGAEFFPSYSIYRSQDFYVAFRAIHTASIILMIVFSFFRFSKIFWLLAFVNVMLALYGLFFAMPTS